MGLFNVSTSKLFATMALELTVVGFAPDLIPNPNSQQELWTKLYLKITHKYLHTYACDHFGMKILGFKAI
jgi:hypothetical protein